MRLIVIIHHDCGESRQRVSTDHHRQQLQGVLGVDTRSRLETVLSDRSVTTAHSYCCDTTVQITDVSRCVVLLTSSGVKMGYVAD